MSPELRTDPDAISSAIAAVCPKGWRMAPLSIDYRLDDREPAVLYVAEFFWGTDIEGGRTRRYGGRTATEQTWRRLSVTARSASVDDLIAFAKLLPTLEEITGLPWPLEFDIRGELFP